MGFEILLNIFLGVFSGVLTSIIIFVNIKLFNKIILPWYQELIYKGLDISGEWNETHNYKSLLIQESKIVIIQNAHNISGKITLLKKNITNNKTVEIKNFRFTGEFHNNCLNITCWNDNRRQIGTINYLLQIGNDGKIMNGYKTFYDIAFNKIEAFNIFWIRSENKNTGINT
jgi:hypothetical protein